MQLFSVLALSLALSIAFVHAFPGALRDITGGGCVRGAGGGCVRGAGEKVGDCKIDTFDDWVNCLIGVYMSGATNVVEAYKPETANADIKPAAGAAGAAGAGPST